MPERLDRRRSPNFANLSFPTTIQDTLLCIALSFPPMKSAFSRSATNARLDTCRSFPAQSRATLICYAFG